MQDTGGLELLLHWDDPEGWYGVGGGGGSGWGTRVHPWWVHFDMAKPIQYCKLKIIIIKKKKLTTELNIWNSLVILTGVDAKENERNGDKKHSTNNSVEVHNKKT